MCGVELASPGSPVVFQRKGLKSGGVWFPVLGPSNYFIDPVITSHVRERGFAVELHEAFWTDGSVAGFQLLPEVSEKPWYDPSQLNDFCVSEWTEHSSSTCLICGTRKWTYPGADLLPAPVLPADARSADVVASPEWFGSGGAAQRNVLFRRELAEVLVRASPRDVTIVIPGSGWPTIA